MVWTARAGNRAGDVSVVGPKFGSIAARNNCRDSARIQVKAALVLEARTIYRLKNEDSVDPAEAEAASGFAGAGCAAGVGAGSSRFERLDE